MKLINEKSRERGSVTIEATISLSAFMFAIVTLLTVINICMVQAKISIAINATAKELSQYSYLYAITGLNESHAAISSGSEDTKKDIDGILGDVNTVFTEIQNIGKTTERTEEQDISGLLTQFDGIVANIEEATGSLTATFEDMAKDPKSVAMGLAKILANDGWNLAMSKAAEGLSKGLCKKNLVFENGGEVESYLKFLGVVPSASGSYMDGLDFSKSTIFPNGSSEIRVNVSYDVKIIALLPIDFSFHFNQTAVTHGWLNGENSFRTVNENMVELADNKTLWTESLSARERRDFIRHQVIDDLSLEGYEQVTGSKKGDSFQDIHVYNGTTNEFAVIHSMNPLYSPPGEKTVTLNDLNDTVIKNEIENMCAGVLGTSGSLSNIKTKSAGTNGDVTYAEYKCDNAKAKVVLVIPEDEGLKERFETIIADSNTMGVTVEVVLSYGNGASTTELNSSKGETGE